MFNRHKYNQNKIDLEAFFDHPLSRRQCQYEVVHAFVKEGMSAEEVALKFGYAAATVYALVRDAKAGKTTLFPEVKLGPKKRRTPEEILQVIIALRKKGLSSPDIYQRLLLEGTTLSTRTIERIIKEAGFEKLKRRTDKERGFTKKNKIIADRAEPLTFKNLDFFSVDCPVAGAFFFIPYIIELGILDIVRECHLPKSSVIGAEGAALSMLLLKLIGCERLSHMEAYDHEPGLGIFAGLSVLPKSTYMSTYSCLTSEEMLIKFQERLIRRFRKIYPKMYEGKFINLDFHSIPHFGDLSEMEKVWCGSRGKAIKGANTVFAQDCKSNVILYTRADILRKEESEEIKRFIAYWKKQDGDLKETLVFDCHFTKYQVLDELTEEKVNFITLRKRNKKLTEATEQIVQKEWQKVTLSIPKRKYRKVSAYESEVILKGCKHPLRQIIIKDHGRIKPTFIITNNRELTLEKCLEVYAKRWHIENKFSELVSFFNLNALSSPLMIRIHFDILWTMVADTIYRRFASDLRRFENHQAPSIFKRFTSMPGRVIYKNGMFEIKIRKRSHTPILMGMKKLSQPFHVPWLNNCLLKITWTP
ncbi:MAG: transposase [Candidatus Humimicrobiaceae bacterium]